MLNPVHLRTLVVVLQTGSFADAARALRYTSSAVSQQVQSLERALRAPLFERDARQIRPTPLAEFLAKRSESIVTSLDAVEDDVRSYLSGALGILRIASFPSASEQLLPRALSDFRSKNPQIEIRLEEAEPYEVIPKIEAGETDVALVYRYNFAPERPQRGLRAELIALEEMLLVSSRTSAPMKEPDIASLKSATWISTSEGTGAATLLRHLCISNGFQPTIGYRSNNYSVVLGLVGAGLGIALVPALGYKESVDVQATPLSLASAGREVFVVSATAASPLVIGRFTKSVRSATRRAAEAKRGVAYVSQHR